MLGFKMDHNQFDAFLKEFDWFYDNGWMHDSIHWDCYVDDNYGRSDTYFVILAKNGNGRLLKFTKDKCDKSEVWSGALSNEKEIKQLIKFIKSQHG